MEVRMDGEVVILAGGACPAVIYKGAGVLWAIGRDGQWHEIGGAQIDDLVGLVDIDDISRPHRPAGST